MMREIASDFHEGLVRFGEKYNQAGYPQDSLTSFTQQEI